MKHLAMILPTLISSPTASDSQIVTEDICYQHEDASLQGFLAYDNSAEGKRPAVLLVHEWWGLNDYARERARQIAKLGYLAFALDMYGKGKVTQHPEQAKEWAEQVNSNMERWQQRALAGLSVLQDNPQADGSRIAAIGYCFGGSTVQMLAYSGAAIQAVVSFHGSFIPPPEQSADQTKAKILILHGAADPMTSQEDLFKYINGTEQSGLDWQLVIFAGAKHSFTNPDADQAGIEGLGYNPKADHRSWNYMKALFREIFGSVRNNT